MIYLITLLIFILIINLKLFKTNSSFFNVSLNLLLAVALYALYVTHLNSIFIVFVILLLATQFNNMTFSYDRDGVVKSLIYSSVIFPLTYLFQYNIIHLKKLPYLDDVYYSRMASSLSECGVETIASHIAVIYKPVSLHPKFYHWFELWLANLMDTLNQGSAYINLYLVSFSLICVVICLGLHDIVKDKLKKLKTPFVYLLTLCLLFILLISNNILDFVSLFSPFDIAKLSVDNTIYNSPKLIYIVPICISIYYVTTDKEKGIYYPLLFSFFYLIVFPVTLGASFLYIFYLFIKDKKIKWSYFTPIIATILFIGFYKLNQETQKISYQTANLSLQTPSLNYLFNWFIKSYIINIFGWIIPIYFLFSKRTELKKFILFFSLIYLCGSGLWMIFYTRLDSSQLFYVITNVSFCFILVLSIIDLIINRRYFIALIFILITIIPLQKLNRTTTSDSKIENLKKMDRYLDKKIVYLVDSSKLNSVYRYNEMFYTFNPGIFVQNDDVKLIYLNASYPKNKKFKKEDDAIIDLYRQNNPYFNECGELDFKNYSCLKDFMRHYQFTILMSEFKVQDQEFVPKDSANNLYIYQLKNLNHE